MAVNTKTIKRRIKSIGNTKKITKAMEMISAVKMRRAVANVLATRNYATLAWEMLTEIAEKTDLAHHPLLAKREVKKIGMILITSNRGLAGGFSSRLLQEADRFIKKGEINSKVDVLLSGRQGKKMYHRFGHTVIAEFEKVDITTRMDEILPLAQMAVQEYIDGKYDKIVIAYTDFVSALRQTPRIKQILPLEKTGVLSDSSEEEKKSNHKKDEEPFGYGFKFEPNPTQVLEQLLPRLVEMQIYQAILESDASEHSARMMAMRSASDSAQEMIKELNYSFNKARQAAITQEISEIVGGAAALG